MKKIAMLLAAGCAIGMLTGCGIPEEEHNAMIADMQDKYDKEIKALKENIAVQDDTIKAERAKVRTGRIELDDASERIKGLQQKNADMSKELETVKSTVNKLESDLASAKSAVVTAQNQAIEAEKKFNTLDVEYQEMKRRFEMFKKNMNAIGGSPAAASSSESADTEEPAVVEEPQTDAQKASSLLDGMSF